jgi:hypothetical protein
MSERVNKVFRDNFGELILFLITDVNLDATFESSIETQQASKRDAETAIQQQVIDVLQGQISVIQSTYASQVSQIQSVTQLQVKVTNETATSLGASKIIESERKGYMLFQAQNGFSAAEIIQYHYYRGMRTDNSSSSDLKVLVTPSTGIAITST